MEKVMNWNFDFTLPSLIFLLFFLVFYFIRPVLLTRSNKCFLILIIFEVIGFFITPLSCYMDLHSTRYSRISLIFINNLYYIIYIARYLLISLYIGAFLNVNPKKDVPTIIAILASVIMVILLLLNPIHKGIYFLTQSGRFHRSTNYLSVYYINIITLLLNIYYVSRFYKKFSTKEMISVLFAIAALFALCIIDIAWLDYIITDSFFLFVILVFFLGFENPDNFVDKRTRLFNTQAFTSLLQQKIVHHKQFTVISFLIQHYPDKKQIYGHARMDKALALMAKFISQTFPYGHCFYLQNGNFAVVLRDKKSNIEKENKVIERFKSPWMVDNHGVHVDLFTIDTDDEAHFTSFENMMNGYTIAYYDGEQSGKDHITITQATRNRILRIQKVRRALNDALQSNSLLVYLQPIVDSKTRKIVAAEALVRLRDKELGIIPPIEFITMAERNGTIEQLGEQVINKVCVFLQETHLYNHGIKWININLSPVQCQNKTLPDRINGIVNDSTLDHKYIHLEITEDSMVEDETLQKQMKLLINDGYKFALDDFGSGYSNVVKIRTYPFSNVKIDLSLVWEHFNNPDSMLPSMVSNFKERGLTITAEGVETQEMADGLENMGVDYLQGFYFSKPIPLDEFITLIMRQEE